MLLYDVAFSDGIEQLGELFNTIDLGKKAEWGMSTCWSMFYIDGRGVREYFVLPALSEYARLKFIKGYDFKLTY